MGIKNKLSSQILIYQSEKGEPKVTVKFEGETVWLTQTQLVDLYQSSKANISEHLKHIFSDHELNKESVVRKFRTTASDGKTYQVEHYNLDVIISLGYRISSEVATKFRIWATKRLSEYIIKGFVMDDDRLKNLGGGGYWKELLDRIRDIRASEKVFYRQILDIYATSIDYDSKSKTTIDFFKKVQNKIHYAVHGQTASEVIFDRVNSEKEFMGLTTFSGSKPELKDVVIAKNYLSEKELRALGQIVSGYLDFAERQAERQTPMKMIDWAKHLDKILTSTGEKLLKTAGRISHEQAIHKAIGEYKKYQQQNLSNIEKDYLMSLSVIHKKIKVQK